MNGGCDICPVMRRLRKTLEACEKCDNGSHHGKSHVRATDYTLAQRKLDDHTPSSGVTRLNPDDEDKLRKAMNALFSLDPLELLLVQHTFKNKRPVQFVDTMRDLYKQIAKYKGVIMHPERASSVRSLTDTFVRNIEPKFPQFAAVYKHVVNPNASIFADDMAATPKGQDDRGGRYSQAENR